MIGTFDKMISDMKQGVTDHTENGKCSNCGDCCADFLPVTKKEIAVIKNYIKNHQIKEQKHFAPLAVKYIDYTCPFRNNTEKKCVIYPVRPLICRDFKCNNMKNGITPSEKLFTERRTVVSMRKTFYEINKDWKEERL